MTRITELGIAIGCLAALCIAVNLFMRDGNVPMAFDREMNQHAAVVEIDGTEHSLILKETSDGWEVRIFHDGGVVLHHTYPARDEAEHAIRVCIDDE
jgi:hypothetical protein|tara:strand:- start:209 stop:499 length:291 start_codon:yes stop_codon:yes gene_type:complete